MGRLCGRQYRFIFRSISEGISVFPSQLELGFEGLERERWPCIHVGGGGFRHGGSQEERVWSPGRTSSDGRGWWSLAKGHIGRAMLGKE